jgi:bile acid-coenzyme A ligase
MTMAGAAPTRMVDVLAALAAAEPDRVCLTVDGVSTTTSQLLGASSARASALRAAGAEPGDIVAVRLPNSAEHFATCFGAWMLGAVPMPVPVNIRDAELSDVLDTASVRVIVDESLVVPTHAAPPPPGSLPKYSKAMLSGGSTGRSKVILALRPPVFDVSVDLFQTHVGYTMLVCGPLYHSTPWTTSYEGLLHGKHVVMMSRFDPRHAVDAIVAHSVEWIFMVPTMMSRLLRIPDSELKQSLRGVKRLFHTAAPCPAWLKERWFDLIGADAVYEIFGSTEVTAGTLINGSQWLEHPGSVGLPFLGDLRIVDKDGVELPAGVIGDIYCRPPNGQVPFEYLGDYQRAFLPGGWEWFGDMGYKDSDGYLYLVDRRKDVIITGGANVYPAEVEGVIGRFPGVVEAAVFGEEDSDLGKHVAALVQIETELSEEDLDAFVRGELSRYKCPRRYYFTRQQIRNEAGKVRRSELAVHVHNGGLTE